MTRFCSKAYFLIKIPGTFIDWEDVQNASVNTGQMEVYLEDLTSICQDDEDSNTVQIAKLLRYHKIIT